MRKFKIGESFLLKTDKVFWRDGISYILHPGQRCTIVYTNKYINLVDVWIPIKDKVIYTTLLKGDLW